MDLSRRSLFALLAGTVATTLTGGAALASPLAIPGRVPLVLPGGQKRDLDLEEYVKGVVPAEMAASWPLEALKAQAIAARTYAAAYLADRGSICASTACQSYNPSRRHARTDQAVDETRGQVLTHGGAPIWAYYSSTCGGITGDALGSAGAYCQSVRCAEGDDHAKVDEGFWGAAPAPAGCCSRSPHYRWSVAVDRRTAEVVMDRFLPTVASTPRYKARQLGQLRDVAVLQRASSGRATRIRIAGSGGQWEVAGETAIRSVLRASVNALPRASTGFALATDRDGAGLVRLRLRGGGWGHGIGLCQYGAKSMAEQKRDYRAILSHYYRGVELVTV